MTESDLEKWASDFVQFLTDYPKAIRHFQFKADFRAGGSSVVKEPSRKQEFISQDLSK